MTPANFDLALKTAYNKAGHKSGHNTKFLLRCRNEHLLYYH